MSSRREKELARMRAERQAARQAAEAARRKQRSTALAIGLVLVVVLGAVFAVVATVSKDDDTGSQALVPGERASCTWNTSSQAASRAVRRPPTDPLVVPASATMRTDRGTISFSLSDQAPCASASLASLASQGFYDNTPCHRLTTSGLFVLQCGDPTGTGTGGPGYQFAEEDTDGAVYTRGTVAMAKGSTPGSTGSQFFIVYKDSTSPLPPDYTPIGTVTSGLSVVDTIAKGGATAPDKNGNTAPRLATKIVSLRTNNPAGTPTPTSPASATPSVSATRPSS